MEFKFRLDAFEGPLDLLLHLIEKNKVDIYDIPIAKITEQYLEYMDELGDDDLDSYSEFVVMAATLIAIKVKMLLPGREDKDEEEDPRDALVEQLVSYKVAKYGALLLKKWQGPATMVYYNKPSIPKELRSTDEKVDLDELCRDYGIVDLEDIFSELMKRQLEKIDKIRGNFGKIEKEKVTLPDRMEYVCDYANSHDRFSFSELMEDVTEKIELIVTFMALLELVKTGELILSQDELFSDIYIEKKKAA